MKYYTDSINNAILLFLRMPLVSIFVLYSSLYYVNYSGVILMVTTVQEPLSSLMVGMFTVANMLLVYISFARVVEGRSVSELGLVGMGRELGAGLLLGFCLMTACVVIGMVLGVYRIDGIASWRNLLPSGVALSLPFFEEMIFRGVIFRIIEKKLGSWLALFFSSLIFGGVHLMNEGESFVGVASIVFVYGPMLTMPFLITRRLWLGIGLHGAWNYTMGKVFSIAVSGTEIHGLLKMSYQGPEWVTGGNAGLEGSLITILVGLTATLIMLRLAVLSGNMIPSSGACKES